MDINTLRERKQQLEAELGAFVEQANRQIAMQQGAIALMQELINETETPEGAGVEEPVED